MIKKYGYTLAEVLIVLALLGILASILLPAIAHVRPNRDKAMFRKAYYIAERIVYEMVNDDDLYSTAEGTKFGLDNTNQVSFNGEYFGDNESDSSTKANLKFCQLFSRKVNVVALEDELGGKWTEACAATTYPADEEYDKTKVSFITSDGIAWYLPITNFAKIDDKPSVSAITVDINNEKKPNCHYDADHPENCKKPDRFNILVQSDGKMFVDGEKEKEYLEGNTNMR